MWWGSRDRQLFRNIAGKVPKLQMLSDCNASLVYCLPHVPQMPALWCPGHTVGPQSVQGARSGPEARPKPSKSVAGQAQPHMPRKPLRHALRPKAPRTHVVHEEAGEDEASEVQQHVEGHDRREEHRDAQEERDVLYPEACVGPVYESL